MKDYLVKDDWSIIEEGFNKDYNEISESIFSLGNGKMGLRGNFEEKYSGSTLQGSYNAGIYYPDKTRVGWWKNGYPEYFAKVLNSCNWIGLNISIDGIDLDLNTCNVHAFRRRLNMKEGILERQFEATLSSGARVAVQTERITSMSDDQLACLKYTLTSKNFNGRLSIESYLDFDVLNQDANYDEKFWDELESESTLNGCFAQAKTRKTNFELGLASVSKVRLNGQNQGVSDMSTKEKYASSHFVFDIAAGDKVEIYKYVSFGSSLYHKPENIKSFCTTYLAECMKDSYDQIISRHKDAWLEIWSNSDIKIIGDISAQQAIRFNIFHLMQTYTGKDSRLNIGPKGFTGEKYGGSTYWDTEAYCLPFYQSTTGQEVAKQLLKYRYNQLPQAIENAQKLGFTGGAALYPMVTMNGEECHNEWEITFEEIHRNGAIAYAIFDYCRYYDDNSYLLEGGLEVLIGISRFWSQRVNYSQDKNQYVMLGVTGPNEYENNVNNNWYTNYIAQWCLKYTISALDKAKDNDKERYTSLCEKVILEPQELIKWQDIIDNMYLPYDEERKVFLQQDGFLDKALIPVSKLTAEDRPINQKWSWDRILRSVYIKQADVLQGLYFFEEHFSKDEIERNFDFYEPFTVHESSLSPCVHNILACVLKRDDKAYEMYLRTSRLDLDDYNNDTEDGLHITSMAGTWMSIVKGFGGLRILDNKLHLNPRLPETWESLQFHILFRGSKLLIKINSRATEVSVIEGQLDQVVLDGQAINLS